MTLEAFLELLPRARKYSGQWKARCPAHDDKTPSLSITEADGKILVNCFGGCSTESICAALRIELKDLYTVPTNGKTTIEATYDYVDESGELLYQAVRYKGKRFSLRRPDSKGGYIDNLNGVQRVPYRLPEVLAATDVLIVEGERDVETARGLGFTATTNSEGAGKWKPEFSEYFRGKQVTIIPDRDDPGRAHAKQVAASLSGKAECSIVELPPGTAKDLTEWVQAGGTKDALLGWIESRRDAPEPEPEPESIKLKWIRWNMTDHLLDPEVRRMTPDQQNMVLNLCLQSYVNSFRPLLPDDDAKLWRLANADSLEHWIENRGAVLVKFERTAGPGGRPALSQKRVAAEWDNAATQFEKARTWGAQGARKRARSHKKRARSPNL